MSQQSPLAGLYAITPSHPSGFEQTLNQVYASLKGGARIFQYRDKQAGEARRHSEAAALLEACHAEGALLIINDDAHLARDINADGVHLGRDDSDIPNARKLLGADALIGISCYNQLSLAIAAEQAGADYVAFGRFFPSRTKPHAVQAVPALLTQAKQQLNIPIVAIGGITPENGASLIEAGADMLAVIDAIFGSDDITDRCLRFNQLFTKPERPPS